MIKDQEAEGADELAGGKKELMPSLSVFLSQRKIYMFKHPERRK